MHRSAPYEKIETDKSLTTNNTKLGTRVFHTKIVMVRQNIYKAMSFRA